MKKTRFVAITTAAAVGAGGIVPANAAQIGPLDQNKCKVTLTAAEKSDIQRIEKKLADFPEWKVARDYSLALEQIYSVRGTGDNFVKNNAGTFDGVKNWDEFEERFRGLDTSYYRSLLAMSGMSEGLAKGYLKSRVEAAYGQNLPNPDQTASAPIEYFDVEAKAGDMPAEGQPVNFAKAFFLLLMGFGGAFNEADQAIEFYKAFDRTETGTALKVYDPFLPFYVAAGDACLRGGNTTVTWLETGLKDTPKPSSPAPSNPKPSSPAPSKPSGNQQTPAKPSNPAPNNPSNGTQGTTNQDAKDEGSSTAGIVIGVIAAVLAIIGIAAAAAPALGLQIPGRG